LLLFCAVAAAVLWVCVLIYRLETNEVVIQKNS
jgi:Flp pilus assembly protein protease CpaA